MFGQRFTVRSLSCLLLFAAALPACKDGDPQPSAPEAAPATTPSPRLAVTQDIITLHEGERIGLAAVEPSLTPLTATWSVEDESIISVDARGSISAVAVGTTMLNVENSKGSASVVVSVLPASVEGRRDVRLR